MRTRLIGGVLAAATAASLAAGCSSTSPTPPATAANPVAAPATPPAADHNSADVGFLQGMIPHHAQAIAISSQAVSRAGSPRVKDLAARIDKAQEPEIEQMNALLIAWDQPRPGLMGAITMSGPMDGMMTEQQLGQLAATSGPVFDRLFLQMMIAHHGGAISQARAELARGQNPQTRALAQAIISGQEAEITEMRALLTGA